MIESSMRALTILLLMLVVMLVTVIILFVWMGLTNLLSIVIPLVPLLAMMGSGMLCLIELLLFFGGPADRKLARTELVYLGMTFIVSGAMWWLTTHFMWHI